MRTGAEFIDMNLSDQRYAMALLDAMRTERKISLSGLRSYSEVAPNSFIKWRDGSRSPSLSSFIRLAESFGFEILMVRRASGDDGEERYELRDQSGALNVLESERCARRMSFGEMEAKSGISTTAFYAWRSCERSPLLCNAVAIAETFGFRIIMRRKSTAPLPTLSKQ
ncbi:DNA-binding phage protein [Sinorhizobium medicae]